MHMTPRQAYASSDRPQRSPLAQKRSRRVWARVAPSELARGWAVSRSLRVGAVATAVVVLVAIAATSAFGSVGGPIVGEGASFGHRPRQISAASAFVLPSAKQCVGDRELTIQLRTLPHVRWIGATVDVNGARFKTIKRSQLTRPVRLTGLPSGHFVLSITARTSTGRSVTATRTYQTCVPVSKIVEPVTPVCTCHAGSTRYAGVACHTTTV